MEDGPLLVSCACGAEIVRIDTLDWEKGEAWEDICVMWYDYGSRALTLGDRLRNAWYALTKRDYLNQELLLSRADAQRLAEWLQARLA